MQLIEFNAVTQPMRLQSVLAEEGLRRAELESCADLVPGSDSGPKALVLFIPEIVERVRIPLFI